MALNNAPAVIGVPQTLGVLLMSLLIEGACTRDVGGGVQGADVRGDLFFDRWDDLCAVAEADLVPRCLDAGCWLAVT